MIFFKVIVTFILVFIHFFYVFVTIFNKCINLDTLIFYLIIFV